MPSNFSLEHSIALLSRTPASLRALLQGLPNSWTQANEGIDTWSAYDVIGHLIHGERTDWIPRTKHILARNTAPFTPFDRFAQYKESKGKSLDELLDLFQELRASNVEILKSMKLSEEDLLLKGTHPALGKVTLQQLLSTWTVHDLNHLAQISRVMAKIYLNETGPWRAYLSILHST